MIPKEKISDFVTSQVQTEVTDAIRIAEKHGYPDREWLFTLVINAVCKCFGKESPFRPKVRMCLMVGNKGECPNCKRLVAIGNYNNFCENCGAEFEHRNNGSDDRYTM